MENERWDGKEGWRTKGGMERRDGKEEGNKGRVNTFSSSLRFSLRFFLRRAISARRMACSSSVRCFLI